MKLLTLSQAFRMHVSRQQLPMRSTHLIPSHRFYDPLRDEVQTYVPWSLAWTTNLMYGSREKRFHSISYLELYTDASGSIGSGGYQYLCRQWFQGRWPPSMQLHREWGISIEWYAHFLLVVACAIWFPHFSMKRIQFLCDNESVVDNIHSGH